VKIKTFDNQTIDLPIEENISQKNIIALPGLIDPHVHFRIPGGEHKETWETGAQAAIAGGVCTVLDMPNNNPSITDEKTFLEKKEIIKKQLKNTDINLNYFLYLGATENNINEIKKLKNEIVAVKMFMGSSTGNLLVADLEKQKEIFKICGELNIPLAVHAENEAMIIENTQKLSDSINNITTHSKIRSREVAESAVKQAIKLAEIYKTKLYILHCSTKEEMDLIRLAKQKNIDVSAEACPHHLFLNDTAYEKFGSKVQMNPPIRTSTDNEALWTALIDGTIDTIGSDHAPHLLSEKANPYPNSPSGIPGIETTLPLLLNAYNQDKIKLEKIVELTNTNAKKIFNLKITDSWVIVDLDLEKEIKNENLKTKCGWSPFAGQLIKGWPIYTVLNNKIYKL